MKHCWFYVVALAILSSELAVARQPADDSANTLSFENGTIANGVYSNECLGFSLPIPSGWDINTQIGGSSDGRARRRPNNGLALLVVDKPAPGAGGGTGSRILLEAREANAHGDTAQEYVSQVAHAHSYPQDRILIRDASPVDYGGRQFFRADYKQTDTNIGTLYFASIFTTFRDHLIGETLTARSPEELDQAAYSLLGISFHEDRTNPKCVMRPEAELSLNTGSAPNPNETQSSPASPQRVRVSQGVSAGLLVKKVAPQYPEDARQARIQGTVVLHALIDKYGDVVDLSLVSGHPMLAPAAIKAVKKWKYRPYLLNGQPMTVETQIVVNFQLTGY